MNEALPLIQKAKRLSPGNPFVLDTLGWILYLRGSYDSAVQELSEALDMVPNRSAFNYHMGAILLKLGRDAEAKKHLEKALTGAGGQKEKEAAKKLLQKMG